MKRQTLAFIVLLATAMAAQAARAEVKPNSLFADNAVLQRGKTVPVWGTARDGERVTVRFGDQEVSTVAENGQWRVNLEPMEAAATPQTMTISGDNTVTLDNIVVGDVWVASGQSNMERQLGPRPGQQPIENWEAEVAAANHPLIREYYVPEHLSFSPTTDAGGTWRVCSPETVADFSAVGYFFARDVHAAQQVPIGILFTAWGGTPAEAWTSEEALQAMPGFGEALAMVERVKTDPQSVTREAEDRLEAWYQQKDPGSAEDASWSSPELDTSAWKPMTLPTRWEQAGYPDFDGVFWFRRTFAMPETWNGSDAQLHLGPIDDDDTTWVNGRRVGATTGWNSPRTYRIAADVLQQGENVLAVRVLDTGVGGGLWGGEERMRLTFTAEGKEVSIPLDGQWLCRPGPTFHQTGWPPRGFTQNANIATVLYNAMIAPLLPFPIKGVIWYQGESNNGRARQYRELFPGMIADWRSRWGYEFPFLFVQIAPFSGMSPEIREAQLMTLEKSPSTAMAVTVDVGDADDIHPARKAPVGARLALAARALAYGEDIEYSGPLFDQVTFQDGKAVLTFTHTGGGLVAQGGELKGFTIAGADKTFVPAQAIIEGHTVVVWSDEVAAPAAVRYGWANVPDVNLLNAAGLPASPFRTDPD